MKKKKILLVDDKEAIKFSLEMILDPERYDLIYCRDITCAKETVLKEKGIDIIFLDIVMPGGSGLDFLDYLKEREISVTVIVLSGIDRARLAVQALKKGACDYITKPFSCKDILEKV